MGILLLVIGVAALLGGAMVLTHEEDDGTAWALMETPGAYEHAGMVSLVLLPVMVNGVRQEFPTRAECEKARTIEEGRRAPTRAPRELVRELGWREIHLPVVCVDRGGR